MNEKKEHNSEKKMGLAFCFVEIKYFGIKNTLLDHEKQQHWGTRVQLHLVWSRNSRKDPSQGKKWIDSRVSKKKKAPLLFFQTFSGDVGRQENEYTVEALMWRAACARAQFCGAAKLYL